MGKGESAARCRRQAKSRADASAPGRTDWRGRLCLIGENRAVRYYREQGFSILARNWRAGRFAEIDLICRSPTGLIVFAEVKTRRKARESAGFSFSGFEDIHWRKQNKIITSASMFLAKRGILEPECRFDVLVIEYDIPDGFNWDQGLPEATLTHVPGAF